jgi:hypothetical protein
VAAHRIASAGATHSPKSATSGFAKLLKEQDLALPLVSARGMPIGQPRGGCPLNKKLRFGGKPTLKRWVPLSRPTFFLSASLGRTGKQCAEFDPGFPPCADDGSGRAQGPFFAVAGLLRVSKSGHILHNSLFKD